MDVRIKTWVFGAALLTACAPGAAHAVTEANFLARTAGDLVELCDPKPDGPLNGMAIAFCQGFAQGAVSVEMQHEAADPRLRLFCLPEPLPQRTETLLAFVQWARATPERLAAPPTDAMFRFLAERYPCPTPAPTPAPTGRSRPRASR